MKHILFLSWWWPYPANNGSKIRIYNLLRQLAQSSKVTLLSFGEADELQPENIAFMRDICSRVEVVAKPQRNPNMLQTVQGYFSPWPRSLVYDYSAEMAQRVREVTATEKIDVIVASQVDMMRYLELAPEIPAILEEVEVTSLYSRVQETQGLARLRAQLPLGKLATALRSMNNNGVNLTVVSEMERDQIQHFVPSDTRIEVIPNGVDTHTHRPGNERPQPYTLIYPGAVTYRPNYDAVAYFIHDVLPLVREHWPQTQFTVTGDPGSVDIRDLAAQPGVVFSGYLESVGAAIERSWATVVPLRAGGGTRLKILESMALGTPVVSTHKGAEGLNIHPGEDILIADSAQDMAAAIIDLFENSQLRDALAARGRELVENEYDWAVIGRKLNSLIEEVIGKREFHGH